MHPYQGHPNRSFRVQGSATGRVHGGTPPIASITKEDDAYTGAITSVRNERSTMKVKTPLQFNAEPLDELPGEGEYKVIRLGADDTCALTMRLAPLEDWLGATR